MKCCVLVSILTVAKSLIQFSLIFFSVLKTVVPFLASGFYTFSHFFVKLWFVELFFGCNFWHPFLIKFCNIEQNIELKCAAKWRVVRLSFFSCPFLNLFLLLFYHWEHPAMALVFIASLGCHQQLFLGAFSKFVLARLR